MKYSVSVGDTFNRWTVLAVVDPKTLDCECACGSKRRLNLYNVVTGKTKSCGCYKAGVLRSRNLTHGKSSTRAYKAWCSMWSRCENQSQRCQATYATRLPPNEWRDFECFFAELGDCPPGLTLDRIDNELPYGPGNCRWVTMAAQASNKRRVTIVLLEGEEMALKPAVEKLGMKYSTVMARITKLGWTVEDALEGKVTLIRKGF